MEVTGKLIHILPAQTGTGKNGPWRKTEFVVETEEKFPRKICLSAWNELSTQVEGYPIGTKLQVSFDLNSREYNGRWFTDVKAWKIDAQGEPKQYTPQQGTNSPTPNSDNFTDTPPADDLPF
ncbi:MAG: DUF3127 domain-containing protein [Chitinophagales bacterium]|nr:DUF3127 domain-containing protein [Chitinophagales bacterium]MDW8419648.1 DUF3127 domain-containing protein [Chitinophagales bacterium]